MKEHFINWHSGRFFQLNEVIKSNPEALGKVKSMFLGTS